MLRIHQSAILAAPRRKSNIVLRSMYQNSSIVVPPFVKIMIGKLYYGFELCEVENCERQPFERILDAKSALDNII